MSRGGAFENGAIGEGFRRFATEPFLVRPTGEDAPVVIRPGSESGNSVMPVMRFQATGRRMEDCIFVHDGNAGSMTLAV